MLRTDLRREPFRTWRIFAIFTKGFSRRAHARTSQDNEALITAVPPGTSERLMRDVGMNPQQIYLQQYVWRSGGGL